MRSITTVRSVWRLLYEYPLRRETYLALKNDKQSTLFSFMDSHLRLKHFTLSYKSKKIHLTASASQHSPGGLHNIRPAMANEERYGAFV